MNPLYDDMRYMRDGKFYISATSLNRYQLCPQSFWLSRFWKSKAINFNFVRGHFIHDCVQSYHMEGKLNIRRAYEYAMKDVDRQLAAIVKNNKEYDNLSKRQFVTDKLSQDAQCVRNYKKQWPEKLNAIEVEKEFAVPLKRRGKDSTFMFFGFMDMVVDAGDFIEVYEIKSTSLKLDGYTSGRDRVNQTMGYAYAASQIFEKPVRIVYDLVKKVPPYLPTVLECKRAEHSPACCNGTLVKGLSKSKSQTCTREEYVDELDKYPHIDKSSYSDFIASLCGGYSGQFRRETVLVSKVDLEAWADNAAAIASNIYAEKPDIYRCYESCINKFGPCDFKSFCDSNNLEELNNKCNLMEGKNDSWNEFIGQG